MKYKEKWCKEKHNIFIKKQIKILCIFQNKIIMKKKGKKIKDSFSWK